MALRRRKSDDYIGPSTGIMKWVNKFCRFVLFPFIHPLFFVILLAVLGGGIVGIHYFADVAYKDIPSWVVTKSKSMFGDVSVNVDTSFITKFSKYYTPIILILAVAICLIGYFFEIHYYGLPSFKYNGL